MRLPLSLALLVSASVALAQEPAAPWAGKKPHLAGEGEARAFVATGRSGDAGPADFKNEEAMNAALEAMGQVIADWQEATLKCAKKESEKKVLGAKSGAKGLLLDFTIESAVTVSFYRPRVAARAYEGSRMLVLVRHELGSMMSGIAVDPDRSPALKEAVKRCGEQAFDDLARRAGGVAPTGGD